MVNEIRMDRFDAVIFDLDGVITDTASVHAAAWKQMFDRFLADRAERSRRGPPAVLGRRLLPDTWTESRATTESGRFLPRVGSPSRAASPAIPRLPKPYAGWAIARTSSSSPCCERVGSASFPSSIELLRRLRADGSRTAIISASRNCVEVLEAAGITELFDAKVDGVDAERAGAEGQARPRGIPRGRAPTRSRAGTRPPWSRTRSPASRPAIAGALGWSSASTAAARPRRCGSWRRRRGRRPG